MKLAGEVDQKVDGQLELLVELYFGVSKRHVSLTRLQRVGSAAGLQARNIKRLVANLCLQGQQQRLGIEIDGRGILLDVLASLRFPCAMELVDVLLNFRGVEVKLLSQSMVMRGDGLP